jgi:hypothetical protein
MTFLSIPGESQEVVFPETLLVETRLLGSRRKVDDGLHSGEKMGIVEMLVGGW